ncbi:MAG: BrnT family toxin, partial [Candidatus Melainabacteria bacterium]|nr:BrnT family toxin [Candidatus Melainabacteria bacterium]
MKFEWDPDNNRTNIEKHGIDFEDAKELFDQPHIKQPDERQDYGEDRYTLTGYLRGLPVVVVYAERREETCRLISARLANDQEERELLANLGAEDGEQRRRDREKQKREWREKDKDY